jgi:myosin heavy subunit
LCYSNITHYVEKNRDHITAAPVWLLVTSKNELISDHAAQQVLASLVLAEEQVRPSHP